MTGFQGDDKGKAETATRNNVLGADRGDESRRIPSSLAALGESSTSYALRRDIAWAALWRISNQGCG
jgi:hypothetical protein